MDFRNGSFGWVLVVLSALGMWAGVFLHAMDQAGAKPKAFVCPPCGCSMDGQEFEAEGACSGCGMARIGLFTFNERVNVVQNRPSSRPKVAILVFDGVQIIDYTGPYEVFGQANYEVHLVSKTKGRVVTSMGMKVDTDYGFSDCPKVDVLLIPGGGVDQTVEDGEAIAWVKAKAEETPNVISVCNGAFILAETGLLNGKSATTFYRLIDGLAHAAPEVEVVSDKRFVESGKFITTAGLSSGIDGSLYLISKMQSLPAAQQVALNLEYNWTPGADYARANFADRLLIPYLIGRDYYPRMDAPGTTWRLKEVHGDAHQWHLEWWVEGDIQPKVLLAAFDNKLRTDGAWNRQSQQNDASSESKWHFNGGDGHQWVGQVSIQKKEKGMLLVSLDIGQKAGSRAGAQAKANR